MHKLHIKTGDRVVVLSGKDRGKVGEVLRIFPKKQRAIVEGANIVIKHQRVTNPQMPSGRIELEAPIHISNLKLIDPKTGQPTRTKRLAIQKEIGGRRKTFRVRVSAKTGEVIDQ